MDNYIEDNSINQQPKYIKDHIKKFNKEPNIIGMFWNNQEQLEENIKKAIKDNKPYDEYKLLTKEEQKAFDKGQLLF